MNIIDLKITPPWEEELWVNKRKMFFKKLFLLFAWTFFVALAAFYYGVNMGREDQKERNFTRYQLADPNFEIREELQEWESHGHEPVWIKKQVKE